MKPDTGIRAERVSQSRLDGIEFTNLPFSSVFSDHMLTASHTNGAWGDPVIRPYGARDLPLNLSALQYGVAVFEGLKAHRLPDGRVALFRPKDNARRLNRSAVRLAMPEVPESMFLEGLRELVRLDAGWVPPAGSGALYIRPYLFSMDPSLRVKPAEAFEFAILTCPFGSYYAAPLDVFVTDRYVRSFPGGTGDIKAIGNYAPALLADREAQANGYGTVLWLDGVHRKFVEECGVMNVFFVADGRVVTPALNGTILPGITRDSALRILRDMGLPVEERAISIEEVKAWHRAGVLQEAFGTGTAATLSHIARIHHQGDDLVLPPVAQRRIGSEVRERLVAIMTGQVADPYGWLDIIEPEA